VCRFGKVVVNEIQTLQTNELNKHQGPVFSQNDFTKMYKYLNKTTNL
jgi:hypothetical protein